MKKLKLRLDKFTVLSMKEMSNLKAGDDTLTTTTVHTSIITGNGPMRTLTTHECPDQSTVMCTYNTDTSPIGNGNGTQSI